MTTDLTEASRLIPSAAGPGPGMAYPDALELGEIIANLPAPERDAVCKLVTRALAGGRPLDTITLTHESLKASLEDLVGGAYGVSQTKQAPPVIKGYPDAPRVRLPTDVAPLEHSLADVIAARASRRDFGATPMTLDELGSLMHHSYGIRRYMPAYNTRQFPLRMVPSSGSLQAIELYLVANAVDGLDRGLYHYNPDGHVLELLDEGNMRRRVVGVSIMQEWLSHASVVLFMTCVMSRAEWKYGARGYRYLHTDAGVLINQLYLVATALHLRTCAVAAFMDDAANELLGVDGRDEFCTLLMGIGTRPAEAREA